MKETEAYKKEQKAFMIKILTLIKNIYSILHFQLEFLY